MKALLLSRYRHLEITDIPAPTPGPNEILIRVAAWGICGSDAHGYDGHQGAAYHRWLWAHQATGIAAVLGTAV